MLKQKRAVKLEERWLDPGTLDSPTRLRLRLIISFVCRWHWTPCKARMCRKEHCKHTAQRQLEVYIMKTNKKNIPSHVSTLFQLGYASPHKTKCPSVCTGQMYIVYCGLQVNGHSTQCPMKKWGDGPDPWQTGDDKEINDKDDCSGSLFTVKAACM